MSTGMKELDPAILEALRQRGRMPVKELAASVGAADSEAMFMSLKDISDLMVVGDEVVQKLSPQERNDRKSLEAKFGGGQRDSIAALLEIRERKLYREDFATFDDYVETTWHRTRQWASQQFNWLRRMELLEAHNGKDPYHLTVDDAQALGPLEEHPDLFVQAIADAEEEARRTGKKRTKKHLQEAVKRFVDYKALRSNLGMPDLSYEESQALSRLGNSRQSSPNLVEKAGATAETESRPLGDCLVDVCKEHHSLPTNRHLLAVARGHELEALVQPLAALKSEWDAATALQEERRKLAEKLSAVEKKLAPHGAEPPGNGARWLTPSESAATVAKGDEEEESDEEEEGTYHVRVTGDFLDLAEGPEFTTHASEIAYLLRCFADYIDEGAEISVESSITFIPPKEQGDEEQDDDTEEVDDEEVGE